MKTTEKIRIGGHQFAHPSNIMKLVASENYTTILFKTGKKIMVATTLGKLQERLAPFGFCRPNRQTVVNMNYISQLVEKESVLTLRMKNKENLIVSKRRIRNMKAIFSDTTIG
ncbi:LytTr DNA-binding domain-containing protein [Spirosomataceae bacterium TFI 002]|nr:LytTr DNA-binding domain-containing protein [Spirosomataceae bacterium TFI 002]